MFLSYGRKDAHELAQRLSADLAANGFEVWQDTREILSGADWQEQIVSALRQADAVLALLSPHAVRVSVTSTGPDANDSVCLDELTYARFSRPPTPIVPVMAILCEPPFCIYRLDYVDMQSWRDPDPSHYQAALARLIDALNTTIQTGKQKTRPFAERLDPWDFSAYLAEKRHDFCGRDWFFRQLDHWRTASRNERALLITGDPGAGKSAIVAQLVHANPDGQVLAYHCCRTDTEETLEAWRFVRSLAAMIASKLPDYATRLEESHLRELLSESRCKSDPSVALEQGILAPLHVLQPVGGGIRYVLVDALDEALLTRSQPTIVQLLADHIARFPEWLRVVATTRKDPPVLAALSGLRAQELDAEDPPKSDRHRALHSAATPKPPVRGPAFHGTHRSLDNR